MLPAALRSLVEDISDRMQVPPEVPAVVTRVAQGAAVGRRAYIQPKQRDSTWRVFPNVWGALVMPSGFLNTPTMAAVLAPIREIEERWREEHKLVMVEYERQKERADIRLNAWRELSKACIQEQDAETRTASPRRSSARTGAPQDGRE